MEPLVPLNNVFGHVGNAPVRYSCMSPVYCTITDFFNIRVVN